MVSFFGNEEAQNRVSRTQLLEALLGSDVFPQISALGIGARGLDTPAERDFLMKVMTGQKEMTRETLLEMATIRRNIQQRIVEKYNKKIANAKGPMKTIVDQYGYEPIEIKDYVAPTKPLVKPENITLNTSVASKLSPQNQKVAQALYDFIVANPDKIDEAMSKWSIATEGKIPFPINIKGVK